ncbi:MAG: hypothetical protein IKA82_03165 [Clostridia bacterium]|nr:hypothetical protein [Clostridia bacterium]
MKKRFLTLVSVILMLSTLLQILVLTVWADVKAQENPEYVLYEENFDYVQGTVNIQPGNNLTGDAEGWIYSKNSSTGSARIQNGKLYVSGGSYDVLYRDGGQTWGNYTLEADFCYANDNKDWGGLLYNVQSATKFQKFSITTEGSIALNGYNGGWTNNSSTLNKTTITENIPQKGEPFRMKIEVFNKTASAYYAMLNADGTLKTNFIKLITIDNIAADAQTGSIGFMLPNGTDFGSFWVDNIRCYSNTLVSYSENFDSYGDRTLSANAEDTALGAYFAKSSTLQNGGAEIKDGALHLSGGGKNFNAVFFTMGYNWTNYVVESDFTYIQDANNNGWAGLMFRSTDIDNFYKGAISASGAEAETAVLNCQSSGSWFNNDGRIVPYVGGKLDYGEKIRMRIIVNEASASLYVAHYIGDTLGEWKLATKADGESFFAGVHMTGTIGIIVGGSNDSKEKHICVDNITVSRIEGADRVQQGVNAADIYVPDSGIVNPPVVVQEIGNALPASKGERPAVVMLEIDDKLNVLGKDGNALATVSDFIDTYRKVLIPAFIVNDVTEANALAELIHQKNLQDCYVVATAENAALVRDVRLKNKTTACITGALIFDDLNDAKARSNARALVADNMSYVAISREPLNEESAYFFTLRQIAVWSFASNAAEVHKGIANGYHGIISQEPSMVYDVYESITEITVSGKPVVIAHRGANAAAVPKYPENTLMGIRAAKEVFGADAVEIDFGLTSDGYVILMHDSTVDRTTNGSGKFSAMTLKQIQELKVDYVSGKTTTVPTFEEALLLAKELDIVLYCHVKTQTDINLASFSYLVEKHDCKDNVILFTSNLEVYNSQTERISASSAYQFTRKKVIADGLILTAGNKTILKTSHLDGVVAMRSNLTAYNYQPLFYPYSEQGALWSSESFYYQLSARGFVNTHSVTDGQKLMDSTALTGLGCVGWLTDNPHLCDDYHYAIDLSNEKTALNTSELIDLNKTLKLIFGTKNIKCGILQLSGPELESVDGGYTLTESGIVTVVYYADRTASGGSKYRVYSEPVTLTFGCVDHSFTEYEYDETHHWLNCSNCDITNEESKTEHTFGEWIITDEVQKRSCECGYSETAPLASDTTPETDKGDNRGCSSLVNAPSSIMIIMLIASGSLLLKKRREEQ